MHVTFPANRRCVAENLCHRANRVLNVAFRLPLCFEFFLRIQRDRGQDGSRPGSEIFGGKLFSGKGVLEGSELTIDTKC
jgi:hypothetical protein